MKQGRLSNEVGFDKETDTHRWTWLGIDRLKYGKLAERLKPALSNGPSVNH